MNKQAAVPLAGLTAWRAVSSKAKVQSEKVLISGIGGGTAVFAMQFALAMGAKVFVTSSSPQKIEHAKRLGATGGVLYTDEDWSKQLQRMNPRGFDVVIDSAGGEGFGALIRLLGMGGRLAFLVVQQEMGTPSSIHVLQTNIDTRNHNGYTSRV